MYVWSQNSIQLLTGFEGNRWSVGPEDELLPEAEGRGQQFIWGANRSSVARKPRQQLFCYTPFSWTMFNDERTGTRQNDPLHNTKRNYFFFFLSLMNHFSRQNTNAIAYKITDFFLLQTTQPVLSAKVSQNDAYFRHATDGVFFFFFLPIVKRLFNRPETLVQYILCRLDNIFSVLTVPVIKNYIYFLFRSARNHLLGVRNDRRHL